MQRTEVRIGRGQRAEICEWMLGWDVLVICVNLRNLWMGLVIDDCRLSTSRFDYLDVTQSAPVD